jgi:hypothetical protein
MSLINKSKASILAIATGVLYTVISEWGLRGLYEPGSRPSFADIGLLGTLIWPLLLAFFLREKPWKWALLYTAGVLLAVFTPVFYEGIFVDSTSNNLWGLGFLIMVVVTLPAAMTSAFVGFFLRFLINKVQNA